MVLFDILIIGVCLFLLAIVSERAIRYVSMIADMFGMSNMAAGFILLSISTSLPELTVSIIAALRGEAGLAVGNVLGSNIANITIIMGLGIIIAHTSISIDEIHQKELVQFLFISSIIPLFIIQRGSLSPALGIVLLILFVYFSVILSRKAAPETKSLTSTKNKEKLIVLLKFGFCIGLIIILSFFIVESSINLANFLGMPPSIIGATIIGLGTSLPELATTIQALKKDLHDMALGNLLGSCITNITLILGVSALVTFSEVNITAVGSLLFFVLISTLFLWYILSTKKVISIKLAYILVLIYIIFIIETIGFSVFIF